MAETIVKITARDGLQLGTVVTTGAHGQNRFTSKQLRQTRELDGCRIDGCLPARSASPAEAG